MWGWNTWRSSLLNDWKGDNSLNKHVVLGKEVGKQNLSVTFGCIWTEGKSIQEKDKLNSG